MKRRLQMTSLAAKVIALEKTGDQYQVIVQISTKYRGSSNTLPFGEVKPYSGSLKDARLDLVYYRDPGLNARDQFRFGLFTDGLPRDFESSSNSAEACNSPPWGY